MMNFTHRPGGPLKIPKREGIKRRVMKMGEETIEAVREMFMVRSHLSFSLQCIDYQCRNLRGRSPFRSTHGHRATNTHFWPSLHTT
jgi:hypothetical protein